MFDCHCESRCNRLVAIPEIASQTTLAMTEGGELSEIYVTIHYNYSVVVDLGRLS